MLQDLSIYFTAFERKLLDASTRFYSDTAAQFVSQFTSTHGGSEIATYIQSVLNAVAAETARCDIMTGYLDLSSKKRLISVVDLEMVEKHVVFILDKGVFGPRLMLMKRLTHVDVEQGSRI